MPRVLIVAYGNPLRCDDGVAWRVAEELSRSSLPDDVEVITQHQLTPELALPVSLADAVFFIDAANEGVPGEIRCESATSKSAPSTLSHEFSPAAILSLARELYSQSPQGIIISISGECFDLGETLSAKVEESLPHLRALVTRLIAEPEMLRVVTANGLAR